MTTHKKYSFRLWLAIGLCGVGFFLTIAIFVLSRQHLQARKIPLPRPVISQEVKKERQKLDFIAVGDIMLSRNVARHAQKEGGASWIWKNMGDYLSRSDFVFGNLEGPTNGTNKYSYEKTLTFNALPELIRSLPAQGFRMVNLANNHILDQGVEGITATMNLLTEIGLDYTGVGNNTDEAWEPRIIEKNGIKIAFIGASYAAYNDNGNRKSDKVARIQDESHLQSSITKAKGMADFVVVTMHAGNEYTRTPTKTQTDFAHKAVDLGADLVIGGHPHWAQTFEKYQNAYIFYSLGNFVFDQEFSPETKQGLTLRIYLEKEDEKTMLDHIEINPIVIENFGQPRLANEDEKNQILQNISTSTNILE